mmetsp:Transcript_77232/g.222169  ORF Transcript_77232/g.222169 Transcript_77232/m.222169 type:complete len:185 (-) Transcript_77232:87-641(-)
MLALPGVEEDDDLADALQAKLASVRAHRCYFLAETYSTNAKSSEALVLYDHAAQIAAQASDLLETCEDVQDELAEITLLQGAVSGAKSRAQAQAFLSSKSKEAPASEPPPSSGLQQRLAAYDAGKVGDSFKLAEVPPGFRPIQCKPLLFDVAHNYLDFPDFDEKAGVVQEKKGGGLFGWFRGNS